MLKHSSKLLIALFGTGLLCSSAMASFPEDEITVPLGLPAIHWPEDNPYSEKKAELGRLLFFDKRLSADGTISCATCHNTPKGFADGHQFSTGIFNHHGDRNSPTIINTGYLSVLFWDGRASSLEEQCKGPIANTNEMTDIDDMIKAHLQCEEQIRSIAGYCQLFEEAFGDDCSIDNIAKAVATFERTILSGNSPFDQYMAGNKEAMTEQQIMGFEVFKEEKCILCHSEPLFTSGRFANIGIGMNAENPDLGRYNVTKQDADYGSFKVPSLRDVAITGPYMHDGSLKTLEDVVDYYNRGGIPNSHLNPLIKPLCLSEEKKAALVSFLHALSGEGWQHAIEPAYFPE